VLDLLKVEGLGLKTLQMLYQRFRITNLETRSGFSLNVISSTDSGNYEKIKDSKKISAATRRSGPILKTSVRSGGFAPQASLRASPLRSALLRSLPLRFFDCPTSVTLSLRQG
jgi:hypothetical protein